MQVDEFVERLIRKITFLCPQELLSVYLVGSRANDQYIQNSDIDFLLIFSGAFSRSRRLSVDQAVHSISHYSPLPFDLTIVDEVELKQGITPHMQKARLVTGIDVLPDCRLKTPPQLIAHFAGHAFHFIETVRGRPRSISFPLNYPNKNEDMYFGYDLFGIRTATVNYIPGFNILTTLVTTIASFRLGFRAGVFTPNKHITVAKYRPALPKDQWVDLVEGVYRVCRTQLRGKHPTDESTQDEVARYCARTLEFENEFMSDVILNLEDWLPNQSPAVRQAAHEFACKVQTNSETHAGKLSRIRKLAV